jgi:hypothetical protein
MIGVTIFGLFLTPVFYVTLRNLEKYLSERRKQKAPLQLTAQGTAIGKVS